MRIHTNEFTYSNVFDAAKIARVTLDVCEERGSRSHERAYEIVLSGESGRSQNSGKNRPRNKAATWDQWGTFLAHLFHIDPDAKCWAYEDAAAFEERTSGRFGIGDALPDDYHGDHRWQISVGGQYCRDCSAVISR